MRICGIICEYNPFHNGHAHQMRAAREASRADAVVCVMSGSFTQRGEPAMLDKWLRAQMALSAGADVVIELPYLFAVAPADRFALGGISLLHDMGADAFSFGSELDDLSALNAIADAYENEGPEMRAALKSRLKQGHSHPYARGEAVARQLNIDPSVLNAPNTALSIAYLRAAKQLKSGIQPFVIRRASAYHGLDMHPMASASAIRHAVYSGNITLAEMAMPAQAYALMKAAHESAVAIPLKYDLLSLYAVRRMSKQALCALPCISEGLENRMHAAARKAACLSGFIESVKTRRYTRAHINRLICHAYTGANQGQVQALPRPGYARVLGFQKKSARVLSEIQKRARVPLITDMAALKHTRDTGLLADMRATDLWGLLTDSPQLARAGRDFTQPITIV